MEEGKHYTKYKIEKCFWGDRYFVEIYEEHFNSPGFAPEKYDVKICEIWIKYSDWPRRIQFEENPIIVNKRTIKKIYDIFVSKFEPKKYKYIKYN